ncbi:MAG: carboxypeptidase-like regulatory domain-containing protein [Saprospiraceae bacterium]
MKNILFLGLFLISIFSKAQTASTLANPEIFRGVLYDLSSGQHLEGASVSIECDAAKIATMTDDNGYFMLMGAPKSCLRIRISMTGYEDKILENIQRVQDVEYYIGLEQKRVKQPTKFN